MSDHTPKHEEARKAEHKAEVAKAAAPKDDDAKDLNKQYAEAVEKGYAEDALTDAQKEALKAEKEFEAEAKKFQDDDDNYNEHRQQV